jgi:tetratricopeptide (TPR) repeat protein
VQEATRHGLGVRSTKGAAYFSNTALQLVTRLFPESDLETWRECEKYVTHAVKVGKWAPVYERVEEVLDLSDRVSLYSYQRGRWMDKQPVDERVYELRQQVLGEEDLDTIQSLTNLATTTYYAQGRYSEAEPIALKALELLRQVLGDKNPDTI